MTGCRQIICETDEWPLDAKNIYRNQEWGSDGLIRKLKIVLCKSMYTPPPHTNKQLYEAKWGQYMNQDVKPEWKGTDAA